MYRVWNILIKSRLKDMPKSGKPRLYRIIRFYVMLAESIVGLLSLGLYSPDWTVNYTATLAIGVMAKQCVKAS